MKEFMQQIGIFVLFGKTLLHFCPNGKYEKYIKLLFGFMIVVQFAEPVLSLGSGSVMDEYIKNKEQFEGKFQRSLGMIEEKWFLYDEEIKKKIESEQQKAEVMLQEQKERQQSMEYVQPKEGGTKQEKEIIENVDMSKDVEKEEIQIEKVKIEVTGYE